MEEKGSAKRKKYRSMGINAFLNAVKSGLSIIFPLITYPYAFRILHAEGIGRVDYASSIISYFTMIASLGISTYAVREGAKVRDNRKEFQRLSSQIFSINLFTTLFAYLLLGAFLLFVKSIDKYAVLLLILGLSIGFTTLGIEWVNTIYEDYLYITIRSIVTHILTLALLFLMVKDEDDYYIYAFLMVLSNAIICITNWFYCRKYVSLKLTLQLNLRKHLGPIMTLFANSVATNIYVNADTTMIGVYAGDYYVGIYSIAVKIYNVVKRMLVAMYSVAISRISYFAGKNDKQNIREIYTNLLSNLTVLLIPASVGLIAVAKEIVLVMGGTEYVDAVLTLQILSISLIGAIFGGAVTYCLNIPLGREKTNVIATILSAVINIALNVLLIPAFKQNGAALTTAISEFFVFFYCMFSFKDFKDYIDLRKWGKNIAQAIVGGLTILFISFLVRKACFNSLITMGLIITLSIVFYSMELVLFKNDLAIKFLEKIRSKITK